MTKSELVVEVASKANVSRKDALAVIDALGDVITAAMVVNEKVTLNGVGTFETVDVPEKTGVIRMGARKGETYVKPAHKAPKFKVSSALKKIVAGQ